MVKRETQEKGKDANVKAQSLNDFSVGDLVWASVKGYPRCNAALRWQLGLQPCMACLTDQQAAPPPHAHMLGDVDIQSPAMRVLPD